MKIKNKTGGAFTLVELLVCIIVIGLLASLVLPSLHHAIIQAKNVSCLSNLRQLNILIIDNDWTDLNCPMNKTMPPFSSYWAFFKSSAEFGCVAESSYFHKGKMQIMMKDGRVKKLTPNKFDNPPTYLMVE